MRTAPAFATFFAAMIFAAPALARDAAATARDRAEVADALQCTRKTGKDVGNCLRDKYKSLREGRRQFIKRQEQRMEQWRLDHAYMGVGPEYQAALHTLQSELESERGIYDANLSELQKAIEAERLRVRDDSAKRPVPVEPSIKPTTRSTECFKGSRDEQSRCLRNSLYPSKATRGADKQGKTR